MDQSYERFGVSAGRGTEARLTYALGTHTVRWEQDQVVNTAGRRVHFMKWTGQRFDEGM